MHKLIICLSLAIGLGFAVASEIQSADFKVAPVVPVLLSDDCAAKPVAIAFNGLDPAGGTVTLKTVHVFANGAPVTNTIQAATTATNGSVTATGYVLRGDRLMVEFSTATNGAVCVTSELFK